MGTPRTNSRERILAAAAEVARETGPGSVSLDAVAQRAGVSKGGLLYNFPSKAALMKGLVASYVDAFERDLEQAVAAGEPLVSAYLRLAAEASDEDDTAAWIFSAVAEDPNFLEPVKRHRERLLNRLKAHSPDTAGILVAFFAVEGLHSMKLFDTTLVSAEERALIFERLRAITGAAST
jgi:AcrR family transcriptional regulator